MHHYLELDIRLVGISPPIWRRLLIPQDATFRDLHETIQEVFGWEDRHLWEFSGPGGRLSARPDGGTLHQVGQPLPAARTVPVRRWLDAPGVACRYIYDFGDGWEHRVTLVGETTRPQRLDRCLLAGERAGPPEDCGGPPGYARCVAVAAGTIDDPELRAWLGGWDPEAVPSPARGGLAAAQPTSPEAVIASLFTDLPDDIEDLALRIRTLHRSSARKALASYLVENPVPVVQHGLVQEAFKILGGLGRQVGRLQRGFEGAAPPSRALIVKLLTFYAPEVVDALEVDEQAAQAVLQDTILAMLAGAFWDGGEGLADLLVEAGPTRETMLTGISFFRRMYRIPAIVPYLTALDMPELAEETPLLLSAILADENGLVTRLLDELEIDEALLEAAESLAIIPPELPELPPVRVVMSTCDGMSAFNVLASLMPGDAPLVVGICIRGAEGLRDGLLSMEPGDFETIQHQMTENAGSRWVEISPEEAAGLVSEALDLHETILELEDEVISAAAIFLHLDAPARLPVPTPRPVALTTEAAAALLALPENDSWFLSPGDLFHHDVSPPGAPGWREEARERLDSDELRARYAGMLFHSARFHLLAGEPEQAAQYATLTADVVSRGLTEGPLLEALLDKTEAVFDEAGEGAGLPDILAELAGFLGDLDDT